MNPPNWIYLLMIVGLANGSLFLPLALESLHAATVPDIRGTWTEGTSSGLATGCQDPDDNGPYSDPGGDTYSITNQTGANWTVTQVDTVVGNGFTAEQTLPAREP